MRIFEVQRPDDIRFTARVPVAGDTPIDTDVAFHEAIDWADIWRVNVITEFDDDDAMTVWTRDESGVWATK